MTAGPTTSATWRLTASLPWAADCGRSIGPFGLLPQGLRRRTVKFLLLSGASRQEARFRVCDHRPLGSKEIPVMTRFSNMRRALVPLSLTATVVGVAALGTPAQGNSPAAIGSTAAADSQKVTAATAVARSCHAKYVGGAAGTQTVTATAPVTGLVRARLSGNGDWDLGVFDANSGRTVAGSAGFALQRARGGLRQEGPEAARAGLPLPRRRVERRPVDRLRRDRRALDRQGAGRRRQHGHPQGEAAAAAPRPRPHRARRRELRRGRPARRRDDERKLREAGFTYARPDRRSRGAREGRRDGRREVRGVEPQDPAAERQQRVPPRSPTTTSS